MKELPLYWTKNYYRPHVSTACSQLIDGVDTQIEMLTPEDKRQFNVLIRKNSPLIRLGIKSALEFYKQRRTTNKQTLDHHNNAIVIHDLYDKAGVDEKTRMLHWSIKYHEQKNTHHKYKSNERPSRQDNKSYINYGNFRGGSNSIRVPSKKRKTAWKRFYKLFPQLKPKTETNA